MKRSNERSERLDLEKGLVTTEEDIQALRKHRPTLGEDWLRDLEEASKLFPYPPNRRTFEGFEPFEL